MSETLEELKARARQVTRTDDRDCDRLSAQIMMVHQHCGRKPTEVHCTFGLMCETIAQPYKRDIDLDTEPVELETGWLKDKIGYVVIENLAAFSGKKEDVPPVVEIWIDGVKSPFVVRYGRAVVVDVDDPSRIKLRGTAPVPITLTVMPR